MYSISIDSNGLLLFSKTSDELGGISVVSFLMAGLPTKALLSFISIPSGCPQTLSFSPGVRDT
jgi:hypothetical protein